MTLSDFCDLHTCFLADNSVTGASGLTDSDSGENDGLEVQNHLPRGIYLYHRERIWFSSTLSCIKEEEEITKPPAHQVINRCLSPLPIK